MSYNDLKNWRYRTKDRALIAMGGKCCICNYNRCPDALAFHHLDPNEKDFNFSGMRSRPQGWPRIVAELRKCVLLCHVCHTELHSGYAKLPENVTRFNEFYATYAAFPTPPQDACPICGAMKLVDQKTCSRVCSIKRTGKIQWDQINLAELLKTTSVLALSKKIGCSDAAIHKRLKKLLLK